MLFQETETDPSLKDVADKAGEDVSSALDGLARGDFEAAWPLISDYVLPAAGAILALIVGYLVAKFVGRIVSNPVSNDER